VWFDGLKPWFVAEERAALGPVLALPPNPFDGYQRASEVALQNALNAERSVHPWRRALARLWR
jgi:hypothetical protein